MPRGDKSKYTEKQKRQAEHIVEGSKEAVVEGEAETCLGVNDMSARLWKQTEQGGPEKAKKRSGPQDQHRQINRARAGTARCSTVSFGSWIRKLKSSERHQHKQRTV